MNKEILQSLSEVLHVSLAAEEPSGALTPFGAPAEVSPLMASSSLRERLRAQKAETNIPTLLRDEFKCFYTCIPGEGFLLYVGPICHEKPDPIHRKDLYRHYGIHMEGLPELPAFSMPEITSMLLLTCHTIGAPVSRDDLLRNNHILSEEQVRNIQREQVRFLLNEEEEDDDKAVRHSYHEEQLLLQAVREGRGVDAVQLAERMDSDTGRLGRSDLRHRKNNAIVGITLCSRAAIEGGMPPKQAYRISGYYIQKCDEAQESTDLLKYRNQAMFEMADYVSNKAAVNRTSGYVEQCRDYIRRHYREKIYLQDIADHIGISPTYLSRLFRKETGGTVQDFINEERVYRASNLLMYSDLPLSEIGEYVHFPSQSYFGSIFKKLKGMSPKVFRDRYQKKTF